MFDNYEPSAAEYLDGLATQHHKSGGSYQDAQKDFNNLHTPPSDYDGKLAETKMKCARRMKKPYRRDTFAERAGTTGNKGEVESVGLLETLITFILSGFIKIIDP